MDLTEGKQGKATHRGIFRVWSKTLHEVMAAENEYFVEEVPYTQYFYDGEALHGAFWHSSFGTPMSHGCINLSLPDARWLFRWAPPALPSGWHSYQVLPGTESLWVVVEHAKPGELPTATPVGASIVVACVFCKRERGSRSSPGSGRDASAGAAPSSSTSIRNTPCRMACENRPISHQYRLKRASLSISWLLEDRELARRHVGELDPRLPELADGADNHLTAGLFPKHQEPGSGLGDVLDARG